MSEIRQGSSGHVWQGRYYSCPLDTEHLWAALRYTELNPVRAGMALERELFRWSSAAVHGGRNAGTLPLDLDTAWMSETWNTHTWREFLGSGPADLEAATLRAYSHTGRPLGQRGIRSFAGEHLHCVPHSRISFWGFSTKRPRITPNHREPAPVGLIVAARRPELYRPAGCVLVLVAELLELPDQVVSNLFITRMNFIARPLE